MTEHVPDQDLNINQRVAQFLMLLQQLDESAGGLGTLAAPEVSEIVSSALGVCGFVDPNETREVIATVLEVLEKQRASPEVASAGSSPSASQLNQARPATRFDLVSCGAGRDWCPAAIELVLGA